TFFDVFFFVTSLFIRTSRPGGSAVTGSSGISLDILLSSLPGKLSYFAAFRRRSRFWWLFYRLGATVCVAVALLNCNFCHLRFLTSIWFSIRTLFGLGTYA